MYKVSLCDAIVILGWADKSFWRAIKSKKYLLTSAKSDWNFIDSYEYS